MKNILEDLSLKFSGSVWGANGPLEVSRGMRLVCGGERWVGEDTTITCRDVTVFRQATNRIQPTFFSLTSVLCLDKTRKTLNFHLINKILFV